MPTTKQRVTINLSKSERSQLAAMAQRNNVSMAWIGHKAIVEFLDQNREASLNLPLFKRPERPRWPTNEGPQ